MLDISPDVIGFPGILVTAPKATCATISSIAVNPVDVVNGLSSQPLIQRVTSNCTILVITLIIINA